MMLNNKEWPRQVKCVDIPRLVCAGMWLGRVVLCTSILCSLFPRPQGQLI